MNNQNLHEIKHDIRVYIPTLRYADFKLWQDRDKLKLQCYKLTEEGQGEFYGNIYEVVDIKQAILQVSN